MKKLLAILVILLLPALADAKLFYIAQSGTWTSYVIAISSRDDAVELQYNIMGTHVIPCVHERFIAYGRGITIMPDT